MIFNLGIYARYLIQRTFSISAFVLLVFILLDAIFLIIAEIEDISILYNMRELLFYVFGVIPHRALIYVEGSCLLGLLISLSISKQEGNLDVLRSAGLSPIKISAIASIGAVAMMLIFIIADENYFKDLSMDSEIRKNQTTSSISNNKSLSSKWIEDSGTFLQYYLKSDNRLYDVSLIKVINNEVIFSATSNEALIEKNYILLKWVDMLLIWVLVLLQDFTMMFGIILP